MSIRIGVDNKAGGRFSIDHIHIQITRSNKKQGVNIINDFAILGDDVEIRDFVFENGKPVSGIAIVDGKTYDMGKGEMPPLAKPKTGLARFFDLFS